MALQVQYNCTECGVACERNEMMAKKVQFTTIGAPAKLIKSRTIKWLCPSCVARDEHYQIPAGVAPGYTSNNLARVNGSES